jgi:puromycin-sensitive aminopeptidase
MLEQFLGEETFRQGLVHYLSQHQYGNARTEDLWAALEHVSGKPVKAIMDTWTKQPGYPYIDVRQARGEHGAPALSLTQRRFFYDYDPERPERDASLWKIPVGIMSAAADRPLFTMLETPQGTVELSDLVGTGGSADWITGNAGRTGFFRVNYSPEMWQQFRPAIESRSLPTADRLSLAADSFALMRAGYLPATEFLTLIQAYAQEREYPVWSDLLGSLGWLSGLLAGQPFERLLKVLARRLLQPIAAHLGWEARADESHLDALLRGMVIQELGHYDDEVTLQEARARFVRYMEDPQAVRPDLRGPVLNLAASSGDETTYAQLREADKRATLQEEKLRAQGALTYFQQRVLLHRTLELSLSAEVRSQDTIRLVAGVAANPQGRELAWDFVKANWPEFDRRYGGGGFLIMRLVESVTSHFATLTKEAEIAEFFLEHPVPSATRTVQQCLERIRINTRWLTNNRVALTAWFAAIS